MKDYIPALLKNAAILLTGAVGILAITNEQWDVAVILLGTSLVAAVVL